MALPTGSTLGPYRVLGPLGAGAMGEVYRARDEKLGREIALKILPASVAADSGRRERFAREARVLASLNHPHIGAIHGFEDATATTPPALVLELVPGSTLEARLLRGPLPMDEALALGRQIADALDAAHERGIIHRDLKPANIKITPDGAAKVLDFGIAKVVDDARDAASTETYTANATHAGAVIGSPAYMSPEQARGETVDRRADIWAFGCVLFEMLSGTRPYPGATASDAIAAVLTREPDWTALPPATPPPVVRLLRRCLQKDVRRRLRDIGDARADLEDLAGAAPAIAPAAVVATKSRRWAHLLPWGLAAGLTAALLWALGAPPQRTAATVPELVRTYMLLPDNQTLLARLSSHPLALSPDGSTVAFVVEQRGQSELYTQRLSETQPVRLATLNGPIKPFFSPDGRWVAYASVDTLQKVEAAGGAVIRICNVDPGFTSGAWGADGTIVWANRERKGLFSVAAGGGAVKVIPGSEGATWPHITPDGKTVIFSDGESTIGQMPIAGGPQTVIARLNSDGQPQAKGPAVLGVGGSLAQVQLVSSGYLVYGQNPGVIMALPVDPQTLVPKGAPLPVADMVERGRNNGAVFFAVSRTGRLVYAPTGRAHRLVWASRQGVETPLGTETGDFRIPVLSPDGSAVVVGMNDETRQHHVWLYDSVRGTRTWLGLQGLVFAWAQNGSSIAAGDRGGIVTIPTTPGAARGTLVTAEELRKVMPAGTNPYPTSWSSDGRHILFQADERQVWLLDTATKQARSLFAEANSTWQAVFSPDGKWIAYTSNASGRYEIWVRAFPSLAQATQVSLDGGTNPRWAGGREIVYRGGDNVMSAAVDTAGPLRISKPMRLFSGHYEGAGHDPWFSVTRDGQRFVLVKGDPASRLNRLAVVQHFFENINKVN